MLVGNHLLKSCAIQHKHVTSCCVKQPKPPCAGHRIFTHPQPMHPDTLEALEMCEHCPIRKQCALNALTAGDSLDRAHRSPAAGVIQAGVWCDGDQRTAYDLADIAGVEAPMVDGEPRFIPPSHCKECGKPMVVRVRGIHLDEGTLTHGSHGYCRICDARRRRSKDWQSTQPKNATMLAWKEKHHGNSGPGRKRRNGVGPANRPKRDKSKQESLF